MKKVTPQYLSRFLGIPANQRIHDEFLSQIADPLWRKLIKTLHTCPKPVTAYKYETGHALPFSMAIGSSAHHMHYGGLAVHTLHCLEYAEAQAAVYLKKGLSIDKSLLYATIILHDSMKRFVYGFDAEYNLVRNEDRFVAETDDHHSWLLREMVALEAEEYLIKSVAAIHGIDGVNIGGVESFKLVNHYLGISDIGLRYTIEDVRPEHVIAFLANTDWHWSGIAQMRTAQLAARLTLTFNVSTKKLHIMIGSIFTFEAVGRLIETQGMEVACKFYEAALRRILDSK
ncbi:MAG: hypothetical protein WCV63_09245 [Negativicutes bacterium]|jgi:hypothetical protein